MFSFEKMWQTVFQSGCIVLHSHQQWILIHCSTFLSAFSVVNVLDFVHSNRCLVATCYYFNLQFPDNTWCSASFHMLFAIFFGEVSRYSHLADRVRSYFKKKKIRNFFITENYYSFPLHCRQPCLKTDRYLSYHVHHVYHS